LIAGQRIAWIPLIFILLDNRQTGQAQTYSNGIGDANCEALAEHFITRHCPLRGSVADGRSWPIVLKNSISAENGLRQQRPTFAIAPYSTISPEGRSRHTPKQFDSAFFNRIGRQYAFDMMPESGHTVFPRAAACRRLDFRLLGDLQRVIDFDAEVANCAFQLGMAKQQLNGPQVLCALVDQGRLGSPHGMRSVG
jgi:hypothetical protein